MGDWFKGFGSFFGDMYRQTVGKMTGLLSIILALAPVECPGFFAGNRGLPHSKWTWEVAAAVSFFFAAYSAWSEQHKARLEAERQLRAAKEELSEQYPRLQGEIVLGYLDIGKRYETDRLFDCPGDCIVTFYLRVVNHSSQDAWPVLPPMLKLTIEGREYLSEYVLLSPTHQTLWANDIQLKERRIYDLFSFGIGNLGLGVFQKPRLHPGWLLFNLPDSQIHLDGKNQLKGSVSITLKDTLGGVHPISIPEIELRLNKISIMPQ